MWCHMGVLSGGGQRTQWVQGAICGVGRGPELQNREWKGRGHDKELKGQIWETGDPWEMNTEGQASAEGKCAVVHRRPGPKRSTSSRASPSGSRPHKRLSSSDSLLRLFVVRLGRIEPTECCVIFMR